MRGTRTMQDDIVAAAELEAWGDYAGARPLYERALRVAEGQIGKEHSETLALARRLAAVLAQLRDYASAQSLLERAAAGLERDRGLEHADTLECMVELTDVMRERGEHAQAQGLHERMAAGYERLKGPLDPDTLSALNSLGLCLALQGKYAESRKVYERALKGLESTAGPEGLSTLTTLHNLGELTAKEGDYATARGILERVLAARDRQLPSDDRYLLGTVHTLAIVLEGLGQHDGARALRLRHLNALKYSPDLSMDGVRAIAYDAYALGECKVARELLWDTLTGHVDVPGTYCHMARAALMDDDLAEVRMCVGEMWERRSEARGYVLPRVLWMQLMATLLPGVRSGARHVPAAVWLGRLKTAMRAEGVRSPWNMKPVLEHLQPKLREEDHALLSALAAALGDAAREADLDALPAWRDAVPKEIELPALGTPAVDKNAATIAAGLASWGEYAAAEPLYRYALAVSERVNGASHPDTMSCARGLAEALAATGDYRGARSLLERVAAGRRGTLGMKHPDTLTSYGELGDLLLTIGDGQHAEWLHRDALAGRERARGPDHMETLSSTNAVGRALAARGRYEAARPFYERALSGFERTVGSEHPATLSALHDLAELTAHLGDYRAALPLYERVLSLRERVLGVNHPDTLATVYGLATAFDAMGRPRKARKLRQRRWLVLGDSHEHSPCELRALADDAFALGDYMSPAHMLQLALSHEYDVSGTCCDLLRVAILYDDFDTVRLCAEKAWHHRAKAPAYAISRVIWMNLATAQIPKVDQGAWPVPAAVWLGRMKTALKAEGAHRWWTLKPVLKQIGKHLTETDYALLSALADALCDKQKCAALDGFSAWRETREETTR